MGDALLRDQSKTGVPEKRAEAKHRAAELRDLVAYASGDTEATLLNALARIRNREGVALTQHGYNRGQFIDDYIDDLIDELYGDRA